jgi:hypothetical protein
LTPFEERTTKDLSAGAIAAALNKKFGAIQDAVIFAVPPPPVQGLGNMGGFKLFIQDRGAHGYDELARVTNEVMSKAREQPELNPYATYTTFQNSAPQLYADVDRVKAKQQSVPLSSVFDTLQAYLGSVYVNDFNRFGRTYRVYAQAEPQFRSQPEDIANLKMRNLHGDMVPMGAVADVRFESGPDRVSQQRVSGGRRQQSRRSRRLVRSSHRRDGARGRRIESGGCGGGGVPAQAPADSHDLVRPVLDARVLRDHRALSRASLSGRHGPASRLRGGRHGGAAQCVRRACSQPGF